MKDFGTVSYAPVGKCIYCGTTEDLRREHIVPYALNSNTFLPKATCKHCAKITGNFEQQVLRGPMWPVRVIRSLKSRTKHKDAPKTERLTVVKDGQEQVIELPLEEYPIILSFPLFPSPAFLSPSEYKNGVQLIGEVRILFGPHPEDVARKLGVSRIKITQEYHPTSFARMIAKIAYSYAFAEGVINTIDGESKVIPSILGERDEIGLWVGTIEKPFETKKGLLHRLSLIEDKKNELLTAEVQLFADSQTPSYLVILGRLK